MSETIMFEGLVLMGVHHYTECQGRDLLGRTARPCVIHRPSPHHMRTWPLVWRDDRGIFERICTHGTGHPDPDQFDYWRQLGILDGESSHGCDGCCAEPKMVPLKVDHLDRKDSLAINWQRLTGELF